MEIAVWFILLGGMDLLGLYLRYKFAPKTALGYEGLKQVTKYLEIWLSIRLIKPLFAAAVTIASGWLGHIIDHRHDKVKTKYTPEAAKLIACGTAVLAFIFGAASSEFELQSEKNGYKGSTLTKTVQLLSDCHKDLEEKETAKADILLGKLNSKLYRTGISGRNHRSSYINEYSLCDTNYVTVSQITGSDHMHMKNCFSGYITHEVEQFVHSGFIASIDGLESDIPSDYEQLFTIKAVGSTIVRNTQPYEDELRNLSLVCIYDGERQSQLGASSRTELPKTIYEGAEYFLEAFIDGGYIRVSNTLVI